MMTSEGSTPANHGDIIEAVVLDNPAHAPLIQGNMGREKVGVLAHFQGMIAVGIGREATVEDVVLELHCSQNECGCTG